MWRVFHEQIFFLLWTLVGILSLISTFADKLWVQLICIDQFGAAYLMSSEISHSVDTITSATWNQGF